MCDCGIKKESVLEMGEKEMKAIIDGIRYDTEKASVIFTVIDEQTQKIFPNDEYSGKTVLHQGKRGYFFLAGHNRKPRTKNFGKACIMPLTPGEAQAFLEEHDATDMIEKHFADKIKDA